MPDDQSQKIQGILSLGEDSRLTGELSQLLDGSVQLDAARPLDDQPTLQPKPGDFATLSLHTDHARDASLSQARVRVSVVNHDCITLEFADSASDLAARYRQAISGGLRAKFDAAPTTGRAQFDAPETMASQAAKDTLPSSSSQAKPAPTIERKRRKREPAQPASAEFAQLLESVKATSAKLLSGGLAPFIKDLTRHLFEESSKLGQSGSTTNALREAYLVMRESGDAARHFFLGHVDAYFQDLVPEHDDDQLWNYEVTDNVDELGLIDLEEYDEYLLIERTVQMGEDLHHVQLEALTIRLATLVGADPLTLRNPVHVRQICRAFQHALQDVEIPHEIQPQIFDFFAKQFVRQLQHFYTPLNEILANNHVNTDIESEIEEKGSLLVRANQLERPERRERKERNKEAASTTDASDLDKAHKELGEQLANATGAFNPGRLYKSVVDAMNFKREAEGLLDSELLESGGPLSGTWEGETVSSENIDQDKLADAQAIARALGELQRSSQARDAVMNSDSLRAYLAANKEDMGGLRGSSGLTAESLNQLDMVDNLFDTIKSQLDVSEELKPALSNLQIPLAKLALMDSQFFVDHGHSARAVVDKLAQLATSANFPNKALESRIGDIVDSIIDEYESDSAVFDMALEKIDQLVTQQERALSRNIERVVKTQEGQEKLAQARRAVNALIHDIVPAENTPKALVDLIESGWRDLLVLTHVKQGPGSDTWKEQVRHFELISTWLAELQRGDIDEDIIVQRSLEAESLLELIGQQIASALPTNISHEPVLEDLRDIFAGTLEIETVDALDTLSSMEPEPAQLRARIEDLPRLRRWVKRVEQLNKDQWLTYQDKDNNKKRMQLAWISPERDRYIFVNERGQKVADLSAIRLARQLSRGVKPPAPADALSVVDRSMYSTLEHVQKTLSFARNHDSLTRLINRETFLDQIERALRHARTRRSEHAVLYINIDQFQLVNEVYDRISGDQVLLEFAKLLSQLHGRKSSSARIKGDEFAVLLIDRPGDLAMKAAEKIRADIEASSMDIDGENVTFTVSIGVAAVHEHNDSVEGILESARAAMQLAKQDGRNQVVRFKVDQSEALQYKSAKKRTRQNLEEALATDRFVLRAQPIVQTEVTGTGNTSLHYELLLGLKSKDGALVSPEEFISSAERYGFMTLVDRWVVREAFAWISELMDRQKVVPSLAINLSGASVTDDGFLDYLLEQISEFGVGTSRLCFEITEAGTISNLVKAADFVRAFRNIGCKFSIDDFGTGLASHNYLRELPVDYVKIDGSFITGINDNRNDYAMARSINDLAHFLGQQTIAESVENEAIVAKLEEIGVDYLQGWGVGKPKLLREVAEDLSSIEK
ncbi:MAG: hypothetical protein Hals2KO_23970 [Halioglobus sp.]